jgi:hypothetical protein
VQGPRDSQQRGNGAAAPSLFGASPKPAAANDELRILSVLEPTASKPRAKWAWPAALGLAAAACTGVVLWRAHSAAEADVPVREAAAPAPAIASGVQAGTAEQAASAASAQTAAVIETLPQPAEAAPSSPGLAQASAATPAASAASSSPLALLAAADGPASAARTPTPAAHAEHAAAKPQARAKAAAHHTRVASAHAHHAAKAKPQKDDADVDLLEALVAHVRGQAVPAQDKLPAAAPQAASSKP